MDCDKCNRFFLSDKCYENHINKNICNQYKYCKRCKKLYTNKNHECNKKKCNICRKMVPMSYHECYMMPNKKDELMNEDSIPKIFVFYDFESFIEINESGQKIHKPNLCCLSVVCDICWDPINKNRKYKFCSFCTADDKTFYGYNTVNDFLNYIFDELNSKVQMNKEKFKLRNRIKIKIVAHNSKSYDIHFIVKYCLDNNFQPTNVIKKGTKILSMIISHFHFIDSLSFLPMALKYLPKTFGISNNEKLIFPHSFNKPENWNVIMNNLPVIKNYQINLMRPQDRSSFIDWYNTNKGEIFDFKKELENYCRNDVNILLKSFMIFRDSWTNNFKIDCTSRCITLAQSVMEVFKTNFLKEHQIAIIPNRGYLSKRKHSYISNAWLDYMQTQRRNKIIKEYKLLNYVVDGFIPETGEIFEFYGCIFHGCPKCFQANRYKIFNPMNGISMDNLYTNTKRRECLLKKSNFEMTIIWECELNSQRKSSNQFNDYFENHLRNYKQIKYNPEIYPRDAFYGGRTNAIKLYHQVEDNEKIHYYDFTSLYPYICKFGEFPLGHPKIIRIFNSNEIEEYNGLVYCVVLPPQNLFLPILPTRINGKLYFPLCYNCALDHCYHCNHTEEDRALIGCWVSIELKTAIRFGYKILKIFEVWHFDNISKISENSYGIFGEFINSCIKGKIEASGWPNPNMNAEERNRYINEYYSKEKIKLDETKIENNPGKRNTFKLAVNSFWGKMGQNPKKILKTEYVKSPEYFFKLLSDDTLDIHDAFLISDEYIQVKYIKKQPFLQESNASNVIIAAYVTAQARLHLFNTINHLGKRCLYFDTDSVVFTARTDDDIPETGIYLGQLTNEIKTQEEPNSYITQFISCGPKNYGIEIYRPKTDKFDYIIKVKGLSLNFETDILINFKSMKDLIDRTIINEPIIYNIPQTRFQTTIFNDIITKSANKLYKLVYDKRMLFRDYTTLPFGYK